MPITWRLCECRLLASGLLRPAQVDGPAAAGRAITPSCGIDAHDGRHQRRSYPSGARDPRPIAFEAPYDSQVIDPRYTYAVKVVIRDRQGNLLYINPQADLVLTRDNPTYDLRVSVEKVN